MSVATDIAMDDAFHEPPPSSDEQTLVESFRSGGLTLEGLYARLGFRALFICAHYGIFSSTPRQGVEVEVNLASVPTAALTAELARRSSP